MSKRSFLSLALAALLVAMLGTTLHASVSSAPNAVPLAIPTPNGAVERSNSSPQLVTWISAALTADQTSTCYESTFWDVADIYYSIDQGAGVPNTTTLTLKFGNDTTNLVSGVNIVASNSADASDLQPFHLFGRFVCVAADVSNTNAVTITVNGLLK